jgi:hypothetical protein
MSETNTTGTLGHIKNFLAYMWGQRKKILAGIAPPVIAVIIAVVSGQIGNWLIADTTTATIKLLSSSFAAFPRQNSLEVMQLMTYEASVSDLVKNIIITAVFEQNTEIVQHNVLYSVDVEGVEPEKPRKNHIVLRLKHDLDVKRRVIIYLLTKRIATSREHIKLEVPEVRIQGIDKNGKTVNR